MEENKWDVGMNEVWVQKRGFEGKVGCRGVEKNGEEVERRGVYRRLGAEEFEGPRLGGTPRPALKLCRNFLVVP